MKNLLKLFFCSCFLLLMSCQISSNQNEPVKNIQNKKEKKIINNIAIIEISNIIPPFVTQIKNCNFG